jgi:hypothetical protein
MGFSLYSSILLDSRECSPLGVNEGVKIPPRGQTSPLGLTILLKLASGKAANFFFAFTDGRRKYCEKHEIKNIEIKNIEIKNIEIKSIKLSPSSSEVRKPGF